MKEKLKTIVLVIIAILLVVGIIFVCKSIVSSKEEIKHPVATFEIKDYGKIEMELYPEYAPNTVTNFIALINSGFYSNKVVYGKDGLALYMARANETEETEEEAEDTESEDNSVPTVSMIDSSVEKGSDDDYEYEINGEFVANKFDKNVLRHEKGTVSLNRSDYSDYGLTEESYNSGNFRFSVMMEEASALNGVYCAFGKITNGFDILENIYNNATVKEKEQTEGEEESSGVDEFEPKPVITSASVETYGVDYGKPEVHKAFDIQSYLNDLYSQYLSY